MKKTIGSAALMVMALSTAHAAAPSKAKGSRMPSALPPEVVSVACQPKGYDCVTPVRIYTEDAPDGSTTTYSYCQPGATVSLDRNVAFCSIPKPAML